MVMLFYKRTELIMQNLKAHGCHTFNLSWIPSKGSSSSGLFSHTLAPGDGWLLPSEFWGELILWILGDTSGPATGVVAAAVVLLVVVMVDTPTASARSGGRSSSSLRLLKAHEALLITTINRLWGVAGRRTEEGQSGDPQTEFYQRSRL